MKNNLKLIIMKKISTIIAILTCFLNFGQTIIKSSIDSGGETATNGGISILYTIGEVAIQETTIGTLHISEGFINPVLKIKVNPKVFLQGPSLNPETAGLMNDDLRSLNYLPTTSPYTDGAIVAASVLDITGNNAIVDWVWIELRDSTDNTNIKIAQSALLQRDGDVVALDGVSDLSFRLANSSYFVVLKHRNHLGVMSANPIALSAAVNMVDFTNSTFSTFGNNAQVELANGSMALWTGDTNTNNLVKFSGSSNNANVIKDAILADPSNGFHAVTFTSTGYLLFDVDMNGSGKFSGSGNDSNIIKDNVLSHPSNGFGSPTYTISATIPVATFARGINTNDSINNIYLPPSEKVRLENEAIGNND